MNAQREMENYRKCGDRCGEARKGTTEAKKNEKEGEVEQLFFGE